MAPEFVTIGKAGEVQPGELKAFPARGTPVAVANVGGTFYAFADTCTHEACSLAEGELEGTTVTCPCHAAQFDVRTGEVLAPPAPAPVEPYRLRVEGDELQIEL